MHEIHEVAADSRGMVAVDKAGCRFDVLCEADPFFGRQFDQRDGIFLPALNLEASGFRGKREGVRAAGFPFAYPEGFQGLTVGVGKPGWAARERFGKAALVTVFEGGCVGKIRSGGCRH